jgi:hypothetical protein
VTFRHVHLAAADATHPKNVKTVSISVSIPTACPGSHTLVSAGYTAEKYGPASHLEVEQGRKRRPKTPRLDRLCKLCSKVDATLARRLAVLHRTGTSMNERTSKDESKLLRGCFLHCTAWLGRQPTGHRTQGTPRGSP